VRWRNCFVDLAISGRCRDGSRAQSAEEGRKGGRQRWQGGRGNLVEKEEEELE